MINYTCSKCKREYDSEEKYSKHIKLNRCIKPYECKLCNYTTNRKSSYDKHINTKKCKLNSSKKFKCNICKATFRDNYNLQKHLNKKNPCSSNSSNVTTNITNNNNTHNITNNNTQNINNGNITINILESYGTSKKYLSKGEQFLFNRLKIAPNIDDNSFISKFKKELETSAILDNNIERPSTFSRILSSCVPKDPHLSNHPIPLFTCNSIFENVLVKHKNSIKELSLDVISSLIKKIKEDIDSSQLERVIPPSFLEYTTNYLYGVLITYSEKMNVCALEKDMAYQCDKCFRKFKTNSDLSNHTHEEH